ncbi:MAG TPA: hypothetical protein VMW65_00180, partial [Chloroflexota bacterium]|nr:hypothetical protein [Chloroflexota bacterium]
MSALRIALLSTGGFLILSLLVLFSAHTPTTFAGVNPVTTVVPVDSGPASVAVDPAHNQVLVTAQYGNAVDVISSQTYTVTKSLTNVGVAPNFIVPWPGTSTYLVGDGGTVNASRDLYLIDTTNAGTTGDTASFFGGPYTNTVSSGPYAGLYGIAVNPTGGGTIYAADFEGNAVYRINGSGTRTATITGTLNGPYGVTFDAGRNLVYVSNAGSNTLSVIDGT